MGVARPVKCQQLLPTRLQKEDFRSSKLTGKLNYPGRIPPQTPTGSVYIGPAPPSINRIPSDVSSSATPGLRSGWRGAVTTTRKKYQEPENARTTAVHLTVSKTFLHFEGVGPRRGVLERSGLTQWMSRVRPSFLVFSQSAADPGDA